VVTITTPASKSASNSRPTIIASAMSVICISSNTEGGSRGDPFRDRLDRVVHAGLARLVQGGLNLLHEGVEMHAPLGLDADMGEEQVHQHGLARARPRPRDTGPAFPSGSARRKRDSKPLRSGASSFSRNSSSRRSAARCTGSGRSMPSATRVS
jgi:hypothetical protein